MKTPALTFPPFTPTPLICICAEGQAAERVQRQCLQLRSEMSHFVTNLQYYLMFEVMEGAWQVISPVLNSCDQPAVLPHV